MFTETTPNPSLSPPAEYGPLFWLAIGAAFMAVVILMVAEDRRDRLAAERRAEQRARWSPR